MKHCQLYLSTVIIGKGTASVIDIYQESLMS